MWHSKNLRLYFEFYKSTLAINLFISLIWIFNSLGTFFVSFCTFGLLAAFIFKEYYRKNDYFFYYNTHISRNSLFLFCFITNLFVCLIFKILSYEILP
ncbi:MAG: hypothetical protein BGO42_16470 [Flavobacterium sp. 40-81]|nr:MAG: hypothetical protein BGO42_16470 [Flavobacterium sp. 40-81]